MATAFAAIHYPAVSGALSSAYQVAASGGAGSASVSNAELVPATMKKGPLKDLLSATYGSADALAVALAAKGLVVSLIGAQTAASAVVALDGSSKPVLTFTSGGNGSYALRISLAASISA